MPPELADRIGVASGSGPMSVDLRDGYGFTLILRTGRNGYYQGQDDDGSEWEWEPDNFVNLTFRMVKDDHVEKGIPCMLRIVSCLLASHTGDVALVLNSEALLLTRFDGVFRRHQRALWWDHYGLTDEAVPG